MTSVTSAPAAGAERGTLRVYLGAAPGVGKTFAMLNEGRRRHVRGADVVIGYLETHGRALTAHAADGLELVPRKEVAHRGSSQTEMDTEAVLDRRPALALVDELAHTNVPGSGRAKRWQDVEVLLDAGIDVITTVNIQHLESLNDVVQSITGIKQSETVPDDVVRRADQIELVDMSPEALRRRLAHGNVYAAEKIDAALTNYFRVGNLTALRELALLWTADRVDDALDRYRADHDIDVPWPTRERVVVALTGGREGDTLLRRGARITQRASGGELLALHVSPADGLVGGAPDALARQHRLVSELGGSFHQVTGNDIAESILGFARGVNASQIVLGASRRGRLESLLAEGVGPKVVRESGDIDVHIVTHEHSGRGLRVGRDPVKIGRQRRLLAWIFALIGLPLMSWTLVSWTDTDTLPTVLMLYLAATLAIALLGGMGPALAAAVVSALLANYLFTPPVNTLTISAVQDAVAIALLLGVAIAAARVVDVSAQRTREAARARAEAETLSTLTGSILRGEHAVSALLERLGESFQLEYVALRQRLERTDKWRVLESAGHAPPAGSPLRTVPISEGLEMAFAGPELDAEDMRVFTAVAIQAETLVERDRLRSEAMAVRRDRERSTIRTALLAAVSHDLRTPLAGIKAAVSTLRSSSTRLSDADEAELLGTVEESADRLQSLVDNLLDMSRLDVGALVSVPGETWISDLLAAAARGIDPACLEVSVPLTLPPLWADEGLVERALANVLENAVRHSPPGVAVAVSADRINDRIILRVADRGPGVRPDQRGAMFEAFQRLGDAPAGHGLGLGLAVARGFVDAQGGILEAEDTPGGGLTMVFDLPAALPTGEP